MNIFKKYLVFLSVLVICFGLTACGNGTVDIDDSIPESFEGMVCSSEYMVDFNQYGGTWTDESGSTLLVEMSNSGDEVRFALYDSNEDLTASGFIQYAPEYGADYCYNEHDGVAHHCLINEDAIFIDGFGSFTKASGGVSDENTGIVDFMALEGTWYLDGAADAPSIIEIDAYGNWSLYERPGGDGDPTEVDFGTLSANHGAADMYYAVSASLDDVSYDMTVISDDVMYWGGENDYYQKMA